MCSSKNGRLPRLGFLGVGWIGRSRLEAIARTGLAEIAAIADPIEENRIQARKLAESAETVEKLQDLLALELDGIVIATPSALHAVQAIKVLETGIPVFCQKPLARNAGETIAVIEAARKADRLLGVDLSYRYTSGIRRMRQAITSGELGKIFAADLVFHNAYGPDKSWFYDRDLSGGGCVIDLGIHLVDLAFWLLDYPAAQNVSSRLYADGAPLDARMDKVEDYANARIDLASGACLQLACSWKLQAGREAVISATFYGTNGGVEFRNVNGSFYEFQAERFHGTRRETIASGTEDWGGRAAVDWLKRLSEGERYDPEIEGLAHVASVLDRIYGRR
jgi:predicted dehydrogenase